MKNYRSVGILALVVVVGFFCLVGRGYAGDKKIGKKDVPAAVLKAYEQAYPHATVKGYSKETENGKTYYEIETVEGAKTRDLLYKPDGTVEEIEESVAMQELPEAVARAFTKEAAGAKASKMEKVTKGEKVTYEFGMGKGKSEMVIDASGKVMKQSKTIGGSKVKEEAGEEED